MRAKTLVILVLGAILAGTTWGAGLSGERQPVQMLGDSMMKLLGEQIKSGLKKKGIEADTFANIGTGLARLDNFDWMAKIDELCKQKNPKVAVVALGANDQQPMKTVDGTLQPGTPEWSREYSRRVGEVMDKLIGHGCEHVIWLMLPAMRDATHDRFAGEVNEAVKAEAKTRNQVITYSFNSLVTRKDGRYTETILHSGKATKVRDNDGMHLTGEGAKIVALDLINSYWE